MTLSVNDGRVSGPPPDGPTSFLRSAPVQLSVGVNQSPELQRDALELYEMHERNARKVKDSGDLLAAAEEHLNAARIAKSAGLPSEPTGPEEKRLPFSQEEASRFFDGRIARIHYKSIDSRVAIPVREDLWYWEAIRFGVGCNLPLSKLRQHIEFIAISTASKNDPLEGTSSWGVLQRYVSEIQGAARRVYVMAVSTNPGLALEIARYYSLGKIAEHNASEVARRNRNMQMAWNSKPPRHIVSAQRACAALLEASKRAPIPHERMNLMKGAVSVAIEMGLNAKYDDTLGNRTEAFMLILRNAGPGSEERMMLIKHASDLYIELGGERQRDALLYGFRHDIAMAPRKEWFRNLGQELKGALRDGVGITE